MQQQSKLNSKSITLLRNKQTTQTNLVQSTTATTESKTARNLKHRLKRTAGKRAWLSRRLSKAKRLQINTTPTLQSHTIIQSTTD